MTAASRGARGQAIPQPPIPRLLNGIEPIPFSGCWIWTGKITKAGYGHISVNGAYEYTHRLAYTHYVGPIPLEMEIDHKCRVRSCCNPDHLEVVTHLENVRRGLVKTHGGRFWRERSACSAGHAYPDNPRRDSRGARICPICNNERRKAARRLRGLRSLGLRTHCPQGHPYNEENTYWHKGHRQCRACKDARRRAAKWRAT